MKKLMILSTLLCVLVGCSSSTEYTPQAPLDTKTVAEYNAKVYSGNTVSVDKQIAYQPAELPLNQSDNRQKVRRQSVGSTPIVLMPSIGYHYGRYRYY